MDQDDETPRSSTTSAEAQPGSTEPSPAAPVIRLLANPRRVRRA